MRNDNQSTISTEQKSRSVFTQQIVFANHPHATTAQVPRHQTGKRYIKFFTTVLLLLVFSFTLGACGNSSDDNNNNSESSNNGGSDGNGGDNNGDGNDGNIDNPPQLFPQPFDIDASYSSTIYVDGSAVLNGNGSQETPFDNIGDAIVFAAPGTRILVAPGTYPSSGSFGNVQGEADAPIAIVAEGEVIIDAGGSGTGMAFQDAKYLVLDGITIQNTGAHGINMDDGGSYETPAEYIVLRNMHFRNIGNGGNNDCLKLSGIDHFYIEGSEFEGCNQGEAIDMVGCHDGVITGNYFHDVVINGVQTKGGSSDILIHGNRFEDIPQRGINAGGNTGEAFFRPASAEYEARNITIAANIFIRTGSAPVVYAGCLDCIVANNTIVEPSNYVFRVLQENTSKGQGENGYFINNIIVFNEAEMNNFTFFNSNGLSLDATFTVNANLWYAMDNASFDAIPNGTGFLIGEDGIIQQDPLLDGNFRINASSPAAGQGIDVPGGVPADYDYNPYPDPPDMGAFRAPAPATAE